MRSLLRYINHKGLEHLEGHVVAPTGSGKTVIFAKLLEHLRQEGTLPTTLIVVPTKQLKEQTVRELRQKGFGGRVQLARASESQHHNAQVIITTQNGFVRQLRNGGISISPETIGLVIFDEAHHMQGEGTKEVIQEHLPHAGIIGFTATPDYDRKRMLRKLLPDCIHEISVHEAVDEELIAPYRTVLLPTHANLSYVVPTGKEYHQYLLNRAIDTSARNLLITRFIADSLAGQKTVINVNTVEHAETMAELLRQHGVHAMAVSGGTRHLDQILAAFARGEIEKIVHAKLLTEGFDEPGVEAVVNVAPTLSIVREKQRVGRGQRIDPANPEKVLTIVECIDDSYACKPRFYGGADLTGEWHYGRGSEQQLDIDPGYTALQDVDAITEWWSGIGSLPLAAELGLYLTEKMYQPVDKRIFVEPAKKPAHSLNESEQKERQEFFGYKTVQPTVKIRQDRFTIQKKSIDGHEGPKVIEPGEVVEIRGVSSQVKQVIDYLMATEDLSGLKITSPQGVKNLQRALREIHQAYYNSSTSDVRPDTEESVASDRLSYIFSSGNNAIAAFYGGPALFVDGKKVSDGIHLPSSNRRELVALAAKIFPKDLQKLGACQDSDEDKFFPNRGASTAEAKETCHSCPVEEECLHSALLTSEKFGIWGGKSERERRRMRRQGVVKELIARYGGTDVELEEELEEDEAV